VHEKLFYFKNQGVQLFGDVDPPTISDSQMQKLSEEVDS
jgi:hypothetical protein